MARSWAKWGHDLYTGDKSYNIVGGRRRYYIIAIVAVLLSILVVGVRGINLGIEFRGGSQFTITNTAATDQQTAIDAIQSVKADEIPRVSTLGASGVRVQTTQLTDEEVTAARTALMDAYSVSEDDVASSFVGPTWGQDVSKKALTGLVVFLLIVMVVMSIYFRAWRMAVAAIIALFHDLVVTIGLYALVGWEVSPATVIGLLTILGYSIYDTVVVFDKVRENTEGITEQHLHTYGEQANLAVNQTLVRSITTSLTSLLPVGGILFIGAFLLGAGTLRDIALSLFIGMAVGALSSIFLATPLEVSLRMRDQKIAQHTEEVLAIRAGGHNTVVGSDPQTPAQVAVASGKVTAGQHLGNRAQPKRKRK